MSNFPLDNERFLCYTGCKGYATACMIFAMPVTIHDVARKAGVSPSTVSRVLNDRPGISEETRERVLAAARELGYIPDLSARSLASKRTFTIGYIIHPRHTLAPHSFYGEVLMGADEEARKHGYHVVFAAEGNVKIPNMVQQNRVDGLILAGCDIPRETIVALKLHGIPIVLVDNHVEKVNSVVIDNVGGAYEATKHLIDLGHRRIAFVCEWFGDLSFAERFEGYKKALADNGIPFDENLVAEGLPRQSRTGYVAAQRLLEKTTPTAIFAANDLVAAETLRLLRERGLRVPNDIAVVGFDDGEVAQHTVPPLSTVRVFRKEMGAMAVRRLLEILDNPDQPAAHIRVFTELVVRESCGGKPPSTNERG